MEREREREAEVMAEEEDIAHVVLCTTTSLWFQKEKEAEGGAIVNVDIL